MNEIVDVVERALPLYDDNDVPLDERRKARRRSAEWWPLWRQAMEERKALREWEQEKAANPRLRRKRPATPALARVEQTLKEESEMATSKRKPAARVNGTTAKGAGVWYTHDGMPMSAAQNKVSSLAWFYTYDMSKTTPERLSTADFRTWLAKHGVDDPSKPGWRVELPNGIVLAAIKPEQVDAQRADANPAKKAPANKAPAKKATTKKARAGKASARTRTS